MPTEDMATEVEGDRPNSFLLNKPTMMSLLRQQQRPVSLLAILQKLSGLFRANTASGSISRSGRAFIDRSIRAVPEANLIAPPPQVLGPVLEGVRYEVEGTPIDEMFDSLLRTSMDRTRLASAHPAFPGIIKNLSADEARILKALAIGPLKQITSSKYDRERNLFEPAVWLSAGRAGFGEHSFSRWGRQFIRACIP
jgi:hypothetical protein